MTTTESYVVDYNDLFVDFSFSKVGMIGNITETIRTCGYNWEITDTIPPKVLTPVHFQML